MYSAIEQRAVQKVRVVLTGRILIGNDSDAINPGRNVLGHCGQAARASSRPGAETGRLPNAQGIFNALRNSECTPSGLVRQIGAIQEGRISSSS